MVLPDVNSIVASGAVGIVLLEEFCFEHRLIKYLATAG
jgi:hypothetical protein